MADVQLAVIMCPLHRVRGLQLVLPYGGVRLTQGKCCGRWDTVETFTVNAEALVDEVESAVEYIAQASR